MCKLMSHTLLKYTYNRNLNIYKCLFSISSTVVLIRPRPLIGIEKKSISQNIQNVKIFHLKGTFFSVPIKGPGLMSGALRYVVVVYSTVDDVQAAAVLGGTNGLIEADEPLLGQGHGLPHTLAKNATIGVDKVAAERIAHAHAQQGHERHPAVKDDLESEQEGHVAERHDQVCGDRGGQQAAGHEYEPALGLVDLQIAERGRRVLQPIAVQAPDGQQAEHNLHESGREVAHHNDEQGEEATARREEERRLSAVVVLGGGGDVEEGRVALRLSEKVGGQVDDGAEDEGGRGQGVGRARGAEGLDAQEEEREALEGEQHVEHVLEEVESGGDEAHDRAAHDARKGRHGEVEEARRVGHKREHDDERAERVGERVEEQVAVDGVLLAVDAAHGHEADHVADESEGAQRRVHEQVERVDEPRGLDGRVERVAHCK